MNDQQPSAEALAAARLISDAHNITIQDDARLIDEAFAGVRRERDEALAAVQTIRDNIARERRVVDSLINSDTDALDALRREREALREGLRGMVDMLDHGLLAFNTSPGEVQKAGLAKAFGVTGTATDAQLAEVRRAGMASRGETEVA